MKAALSMADLADKLKAAGIQIKLIKATGQILYKAVGLDGMWVPSDALGVGYAADEMESALKDKKTQLKEGRESRCSHCIKNLPSNIRKSVTQR